MSLQRIIVIRRDNIGDLVCTTPLFAALREHFPSAHIAALVNSYNAPVLAGNLDLDAVHVYRKAKHREIDESRIGIWWRTGRLLQHLRHEAFDLAIVATPAHQAEALKFARWIKAKRIIAYGTANDGISDPIAVSSVASLHETEAVMRLLSPLGINARPGPLHVFAPPQAAALVVPEGSGPLIALHISARKPSQRWPMEYFAALAAHLHTRYAARFLVFWAPGASDHPQHPGDDDKAALLRKLCTEAPLAFCPTTHLEELIGGLARADYVICSDGGGMHIAAGLGKPVLCFFGNSSIERWHPWGVAYEVLQKPSQIVSDICLEEAAEAFARLVAKVPIAPQNA